MSELKRILLVDDSELALDMARQALESAGFEVINANGLEELESLRKRPNFDLVLMDVQMPELFGDDVAAVMRHVDQIEAPIYLFSNLDAAELDDRAREANIDGYICKRDGLQSLVTRVRSILGGD